MRRLPRPASRLVMSGVEMRNAIHVGVLLGLVAAAASGCATTQANAPVERPVLEVPPVPPRLIEPPPPPQLPPPEPVPDLPAAPANPRPRPQGARDNNARPDPKVAETPPVEAPVPVAQPPVQAAVPPLRMPSTPEGAEATRQIREITQRAQGILNTVDYRMLTPERRAQYDSAKMFITQAEDAIKAANFEFARSVAEKAEKLARDLQSR
jgi:outer membrane biosynthesis protein TonB